MMTFRLEIGALAGEPEHSENLLANDLDEALWISKALVRAREWKVIPTSLKLISLGSDGDEVFVSV